MSQRADVKLRNCGRLEQKYVEVFEFANRERRLRKRLVSELSVDPLWRATRQPWRWILFPWLLWDTYKETLVLMEEESGHVGPAHRRRMLEIATASQRSDEQLFQAVTSEFPLGAAADLLRERLNLDVADLKALVEIHTLKHSELGGSYAPKRLLPIALTLLTLAVNLVPEEVFEYFGWSNYPQYQAYAFVFTIVVLLYFGFLYLPLMLKSQRLDADSNHCGLLLTYMLALESSMMSQDSESDSP